MRFLAERTQFRRDRVVVPIARKHLLPDPLFFRCIFSGRSRRSERHVQACSRELPFPISKCQPSVVDYVLRREVHGLRKHRWPCASTSDLSPSARKFACAAGAIVMTMIKPCDAAARVCERSATEPLPQSARQCGHSRPLRSLKDSRRRWIAEAMRSSVVTHHRCRNKKSVIQ